MAKEDSEGKGLRIHTALGQEMDPGRSEQRSGCVRQGIVAGKGRTNSPTLLTRTHWCHDSLLSPSLSCGLGNWV